MARSNFSILLTFSGDKKLLFWKESHDRKTAECCTNPCLRAKKWNYHLSIEYPFYVSEMIGLKFGVANNKVKELLEG